MASPEAQTEPKPAGPDPRHEPFSTKSVLAYYVSITGRYRKSLVVMAIFLGLFALLSSARIASIGLILDSLRLYRSGATPTEAEATPVPDAGAESADSSIWKTGSSVDTLESVWSWFRPESGESISDLLSTSDGFWTFLVGFVISLGVASTLLGVCFYIKERIVVSVIARMSVDTRKALFDHLTKQSVSYFHDRRAGDLTSRVTNDVEIVQHALHHLYMTLVQQPVMIVFGLGVALWASPLLLLISLPLLILITVPIFSAGRRVIKHGRRRQQNLGIITEALQQLFSGIRIVKAFGMEPYERKEFEKKNIAFGRAFRKTIQAKVAGRAVQEILYSLGITGLLVLGAYLIMNGHLTEGRFSTFILAMVQIYGPVKAASKAVNQLQEAHPGVERVLELLRSRPKIKDREGAAEFPGLRETVSFAKVGFSYADAYPGEEEETDERPVIRDFDLEVRRGEVIALVGSSGAGKSTIVDLLARFYDVQQGAVRIDGVDIRKYTHSSYLESIALVSQDPFLFNTTIGENIRYGRADASDDEVRAAA
ncbi:MAG: ABC transporter ATP-binding protein, partial [Planctomycetota bacterium]